jgi:S1-C subfamily serine protease
VKQGYFKRPGVGRAFLILIALASTNAMHTQAQSTAQNSSGAAATPAGPRFRMLRAVSGTKGVEGNGRFIIQDPRTVFHPSEDRKVIVEFEWEGPIGPHQIQGLWKDPSGKTKVVSDFQYEAKNPQFAAYLTLLLDENAMTGIWTIEARIDGETAGSFSFEIAAGPGGNPIAPARVPLTPAEIYNKAVAATVSVVSLDALGKQIDRTCGFFIGSGRVLTAFKNIDGASALQIFLSNGKSVSASQVLSWDRLQDWAVLGVSADGMPSLNLAPNRSWSVGEHYYSIGVSSSGGRIIQDGAIVGHDTQPPFGERLNLSMPFDAPAVGAPVFNEFGDVIGMLGGSLVPGSSSPLPPMAGSSSTAPTALAVPIYLVRTPTTESASATLADLMLNGEFIRPLRGQEQVSYAAFALAVDRKNGTGSPRDIRDQFSHSDKQMIVFVQWDLKAKIKGVATLKFYGPDNKQLIETRPLKINLRPGNIRSDYWAVPVTSLPPNMYRADLYLGDDPMWRGYFRIVP